MENLEGIGLFTDNFQGSFENRLCTRSDLEMIPWWGEALTPVKDRLPRFLIHAENSFLATIKLWRTERPRISMIWISKKTMTFRRLA